MKITIGTAGRGPSPMLPKAWMPGSVQTVGRAEQTILPRAKLLQLCTSDMFIIMSFLVINAMTSFAI